MNLPSYKAYVMYKSYTNKINTMTQALNNLNYKMIQISQLDCTLKFELIKAYWIALWNSSQEKHIS